MPTEENKISLKNAIFTPATFQGFAFTPQQEDMSLLQRSIDKLDERKEKTDQQRGAILSAINKLNLNQAEDKWKYDYADRIKAKIDSAIQFGDYSNALEVATNLARTADSSPEVLGRVRANEQYEKELQLQQARRDKGDISNATYNWWLKRNPYKYQDTYDNNGNIVGGSNYEPSFRPVNDINWASTAMAAFKLITPYKDSKSKDEQTQVTNNTGETITRNGKTYKPGEVIGSSSHSTITEEKVTKEQITSRMEELLSSTRDGYKQAEQAFDVALDDFKNLVEQYNEAIRKDPNSKEAKNLGQKIDVRKKIMYRNGSIINYEEYYARMITDSLYADGLAYDWRTENKGGSSSYGISDVSEGSNSNGNSRQVSGNWFPGSHLNIETGLWEGPSVQQAVDTNSSQQKVGESSGKIVGRFNNKKS